MSNISRSTSFSFISCNNLPGAWPYSRKVGAKSFASTLGNGLTVTCAPNRYRAGKITDQGGLEPPEHCCQGQVGFAKSNAASNGLLVLYYLWPFGPALCRSTASGASLKPEAATGASARTGATLPHQSSP